MCARSGRARRGWSRRPRPAGLRWSSPVQDDASESHPVTSAGDVDRVLTAEYGRCLATLIRLFSDIDLAEVSVSSRVPVREHDRVWLDGSHPRVDSDVDAVATELPRRVRRELASESRRVLDRPDVVAALSCGAAKGQREAEQGSDIPVSVVCRVHIGDAECTRRPPIGLGAIAAARTMGARCCRNESWVCDQTPHRRRRRPGKPSHLAPRHWE
jgi:hypothetical protein